VIDRARTSRPRDLKRGGRGSLHLLSVLALCGSSLSSLAGAAVQTPALVVCADPNNLPFSNRAGAGFENKLSELLARDLHMRVEYVWWAQRRGYVRHTLSEAKCDIWPGVATGVERIATTQPYYRSTYVFVTRRDRPLQALTLDDARLKSLSIGVQMVGDNAMNTPPAHALAARGLVGNVRGYMLYGDYGRPNPPAAIIDAVAHGKVDVALVWGPLAGFFAERCAIALRLTPVTAAGTAVPWPMVYDISVGVRRDKPELQKQIDVSLNQEKLVISAILRSYHVPQSSAAAFDTARANDEASPAGRARRQASVNGGRVAAGRPSLRCPAVKVSGGAAKV
jgi:mxaJ protein